MLRAAKHLLFLIETNKKQILRSAQDDMLGGFFSSLLGFPHSRAAKPRECGLPVSPRLFRPAKRPTGH